MAKKRSNSSKTSAPKRKRKGPGYRLHKPTGQGFVELDGRRFYCGRYELPESEAKAHRLIAAWIANGRRLDDAQPEQVKAESQRAARTIAVEEIAWAFWQDAERRYITADGTPKAELAHYKSALAILHKLHGPTEARNFGPNALRLCRDEMVARGWSRCYIAQQVGRIRRVFAWGVAHEMIDAGIITALEAVEGLRYGEQGVSEGRKVKPVPIAYIDAVKRHVASPVAALIDLQLLTAARPGELVTMRPRDLNTTGKVWTYSPEQHKGAHRGHERTIYLGPKAQQVVAPFLNRPLEACCFSPAEAEAERRARQRRERKTPVWPSHAARYERQRKAEPRWKPGDGYTTDSYRRAIAHGVVAANREAAERAAKQSAEQGRKVEPVEIPAWTPHQLRHNAATELRREYGIEAARVILGHRSPAITETYAELDRDRAVDIIGKVG